MKIIKLLFLLFGLAFYQSAWAQDKILLRNGDEMLVKVLELSPDSVYFSHHADSTSKKLVSLPKTAVFSITYQNGNIEAIATPKAENQQNLTDLEMYYLGQQDAKKNHSALGAYAGTMGATVLLGPALGLPAGLLTGGVLGFTKVPEKKIKSSRPELKEFPSYRTGYMKQAQKKKRVNAIAGFGTGVAAWGVLIVIVLSSFGK